MKQYLNQILLILFVLILYSSCKKDPVDYREKYCGDWNFETKFYDQTYPGDNNDVDTIYNYEGVIWYDSAGKVNIKFREDYIITVKVSLEGEITDNIIRDNEIANGEFINHDSLFIDLRSGGYNFASRQFIYGKKIE